MPLRYLLDENLRGGPLWQAIQQHNAHGADLLDATRVGDPADLPLGSSDSYILLWAERADCVLVSSDKRTIPGQLAAHLQAGHHSPGVFLLRAASPVSQVLDALVLAAHAGDPLAYRDRVQHIP
jgi:hypothetical protein